MSSAIMRFQLKRDLLSVKRAISGDIMAKEETPGETVGRWELMESL